MGILSKRVREGGRRLTNLALYFRRMARLIPCDCNGANDEVLGCESVAQLLDSSAFLVRRRCHPSKLDVREMRLSFEIFDTSAGSLNEVLYESVSRGIVEAYKLATTNLGLTQLFLGAFESGTPFSHRGASGSKSSLRLLRVSLVRTNSHDMREVDRPRLLEGKILLDYLRLSCVESGLESGNTFGLLGRLSLDVIQLLCQSPDSLIAVNGVRAETALLCQESL